MEYARRGKSYFRTMEQTVEIPVDISGVERVGW